jgi:hypothetical protein
MGRSGDLRPSSNGCARRKQCSLGLYYGNIMKPKIATVASRGKRRLSTAGPRWGWSGVAPLTAVQLSASDIDNLRDLLLGHRSPIAQIVLSLRDLGVRYCRYLHQDEFGPTRAQRMAALRLLLEAFDLLLSRLNELPEHLRLRLSKHLASRGSPVERDIDDCPAHRNDEEAVREVAEAAVDERRMLYAASATHDVELMNELSGAAETTLQLLWTLDTTTAGAVAIDAELPRLAIEGGAESDVIGFAVVCARIGRLRRRVEVMLARLRRQKGPECSVSSKWLVWQLCDLYHHETGRPVTSSAAEEYCYTGTPQSPAGRFVLAAIEALQPSEAWAQEPDHRVAPRRVRVLNKGRLRHAVYFAMREYVAHHRAERRLAGSRELSE